MIDQLIEPLAEQQCGVFARFQVLALGGDDDLIRRRRRSGRWSTPIRGVYALPGHPETWNRRLWIAYLAAGRDAIVSHHSAAALFGLPGFPRRGASVTVPHPRHLRIAGVTVHQTRVLPRHHWIVFAGRRTTTLARVLVDLAPTISRVRLDLAYEHALLTGHLTPARMARCFQELLSPGRFGMAKLGSILDARSPGEPVPASELERLLLGLVESLGLRARLQYPLPGTTPVHGCVDLALVEAKLILEGDGRRWHSRVADFARDRARDRQAARAGWQTLRFAWEEVAGDPDDVAASIREVYDQRVALLAAPA